MIAPWNLAMAISAAVSCLASGLVCLTYFLFPELQSLRFIELVFYISINDFLSSLGAGFGHPTNYIACWFQAITTNYNYLVSASWTCVITYQLYRVITYNNIIQANELVYFHVICWIFPALVTLLPFTTYNSYGLSDDDAIGWCFIVSTSRSPSYGVALWEILAFYLWLWSAILIQLVFIVMISVKIRGQNHPSSVLLTTIQKLYWYPIVFIASWIIPTISDFSNVYTSNDSAKFGLSLLSNTIPIYQGFFLAIIFFSKNPLVRDRWRLLFEKMYESFISSSLSLSSSGKQSVNKNMTLPSFNDDHPPAYSSSFRSNSINVMISDRESRLSSQLTLESDYIVYHQHDESRLTSSGITLSALESTSSSTTIMSSPSSSLPSSLGSTSLSPIHRTNETLSSSSPSSS